MPEGQVLEFTRVTKRFGAVTAVSDFTARIEPGIVTGFLGPNGAGKTTSLRMLLGLVRPTSGTATIGGSHYAELKHPMRTVGAALEASSFHPGRTGANHLKVYARAANLPLSRVDEVLGLVGLADVGGRKVGGYSLGMRQRLGLAAALLGDPGVIVLDEPANGLDPEGIRWIRTFLRQLAREGRTVLTSSHLLTEVQQTAQALVIISQGRLVFAGGMHELAAEDEQAVVVDSPDRAALVQALRDNDVPFEVLRVGLTVRGTDAAAVGAIASGAGVALSSLQKRGPALEEVFLELVNGLRVHPSASGIAGTLEAGDGKADAAEPDAVPSSTPDSTPTPADATPSLADATPSWAPELVEGPEATSSPADTTPAPADATSWVPEPVEGPEATSSPPDAASSPADTTSSAADATSWVPEPVEGPEDHAVSPEDHSSPEHQPTPPEEPARPLPGATALAAAVAGLSAFTDEDKQPVDREQPVDPDEEHIEEPAPAEEPTSVFEVAATGVISVVPSAATVEPGDEQPAEEHPAEEHPAEEPEPTDSEAATEATEEPPAPDDAAEPAPSPWTVAATGVIDLPDSADDGEHQESEPEADPDSASDIDPTEEGEQR